MKIGIYFAIMLFILFITISLLWLGLAFMPWLVPARYATKILRIIREITVVNAILTALIGYLALAYAQSINIALPLFSSQFHTQLQIDPLSAFFIFLMGLALIGITWFSVHYFQHYSIKQQKYIQAWFSLFVLAMLFVLIADDVFSFLFSWELMALSSYFLVVSVETGKSTRRAGFLYLGITHLGLLMIAMSFFLLNERSGVINASFTQLMSLPHLNETASAVFVLALIGFGAKAGFFPLHVWLPEAHPAAPSPVSALMSGVMLKLAIYALLRFSFGFLLQDQQLWWGMLLMGIGLVTMLVGVIHAAMQTDMKRLLAYSSMENMGFIALALGSAITFYQYHLPVLASLALLVTLLHCLNHSLFKSLLFLGTGSILHATGERNLGKLGGLIHSLPWVSVCTLIGTLAMAGLPLFNGFISEWLYLKLFFSHSLLSHFTLAILSSLIVALTVLVFGLSGFVIVKFFGIAFLGQPRESRLTHVHPTAVTERIALGWLAGLCVLFGIWPNQLIDWIQAINAKLIPHVKPIAHNTWILSLQASSDVGFSPLLVGIGLFILLALVFLIFKYLFTQPIRRASPWDCGYRWITSRMQDSAEGFGQPFKQIFNHIVDVKLTLPSADDPHPIYRSQLKEKIWRGFYYPLVIVTTRIAAVTKWMQQGKISTYLLYIGITLIILFSWVVWL